MKTGSGGIVFNVADGYLAASLKEDIKLEDEKEPEVIIVLYNLDVEKIHEKFDSLKNDNSLSRWTLLGGKDGSAKSCSNLVYDLLNAGGIKKFVSWDIVSTWWTVAPDAIARVIYMASESREEKEAGSQMDLPKCVTHRVTVPDWVSCADDLNPHNNAFGSYLGSPSKVSP